MAEAEITWSDYKQKGNTLYGSHKYKEAIIQYTKAVDALVSLKNKADDLPCRHREELAKIYSNRSASYFQHSTAETGFLNKQVLDSLVEILKSYPDRLKYRAAIAIHGKIR